jgi:uncharacterized small protein (DUF1192 family)
MDGTGSLEERVALITGEGERASAGVRAGDADRAAAEAELPPLIRSTR